MIIPTAEFDPLFADDGVPFAEKMHTFIRLNFADLPERDELLSPLWLQSDKVPGAAVAESGPRRRRDAA